MRMRTARKISRRGNRWFYKNDPVFARAQRRLARFYNRNLDALKSIIEVPTIQKLWGQPHTIVPRVVDEKFGDGMQLIWLSPINNRPMYYVCRIDSATNLSNHSNKRPFCDRELDNLYEAVEVQFGSEDFECDLCGGCEFDTDSTCECQAARSEAPSLNGGCSWGSMEWPS